MSTTPSVYVGTYRKYNCGNLFGKWFDLIDFYSEEEFIEACNALHANESEPELMFQAWDGIPSQFISESWVDWNFIEAFKQATDDGQADAFIAWVELMGKCDYDSFEDKYRGEAESEEAYAYTSVEDSGMLSDVPSELRTYFDYNAYARDLFSSDLVFHNGFVFDNY